MSGKIASRYCGQYRVSVPDLRMLSGLSAIADTHAKRGDDFSAPSLMSGGGAKQSPTPNRINTHPNKGEDC